MGSICALTWPLLVDLGGNLNLKFHPEMTSAVGPCGPCSELYYDLHPERGDAGADLGDDGRFIEFYNLVFMESDRAADGTLSPLAARCIDTGMGLERVAQALLEAMRAAFCMYALSAA